MPAKLYPLKTQNHTKALAEQLATELGGGEVIGLIGDLGTGKTTFTQYLAAALGVEDLITSPTFTIMQIYQADAGAIKRLVHIDAYRLTGTEDVLSLGVEDYFADPATVTVIEWATRAMDILPSGSKIIHFKQTSTMHSAEITIQP
jgi:tRNA threonylcarbamoyladenosine biosynthesis protein TsaE